jgi:hypothetical protein
MEVTEVTQEPNRPTHTGFFRESVNHARHRLRMLRPAIMPPPRLTLPNHAFRYRGVPAPRRRHGPVERTGMILKSSRFARHFMNKLAVSDRSQGQ